MDERVLFKPAVVCTDDDEFDSFDSEEDFSLSVQLQGLFAQYESLYVDFIKPRDQEILEELTDEHKRPSQFRKAVRQYVDNVKHALKRDTLTAVVYKSVNEELFGLICELDNELDPYLYFDIYGKSHLIYDDIALKTAMEEYVRRAPTAFLCPYNEFISEAQDLLRRVGELDMNADDDLDYCAYPFFTDFVVDSLKLMNGCTKAYLLKKVDEVEKYCADLIIEREEAKRLQKEAERKNVQLEAEVEVLTAENQHLRGIVDVYVKQESSISSDLDLVKAKVEFLAQTGGLFASKSATPEAQRKAVKPITPEETSPKTSPENSFDKHNFPTPKGLTGAKRSLRFGEDAGLVQ